MANETTITVIGNLTGDPELRYTPAGVALAKFTVASTPRVMDRTSGQFKDGEPLFLTCTVWRDMAEHAAESLVKGTRVIVHGRLRLSRWEDKETGEKRSMFQLDVDEVGPSLRFAQATVRRMSRAKAADGFTSADVPDDAWNTAAPAAAGQPGGVTVMPPIVTADNGSGPVPVGPALSIFDPVHIGIDEFGQPVRVGIAGRNMLIGGDPGSGKSALLNAVVAHAALSLDCRLILLDGKRVELGQWKQCAAAFVGPDLPGAITLLRRIQVMIDRRTDYLERCERRKIAPGDTFATYLVAVDEIAYFSATVGKKPDREDFANLLRDVVARGRAVGVPVVAATQRPSSDIIPTSLRDLFAWRFAGRCSTDSSSDIVLGHGWVQKGWSSNTIAPTNPGVGLLIAEGGSPQLVKTVWLDDDTCRAIARYAASLRQAINLTAASPPANPAGAVTAA